MKIATQSSADLIQLGTLIEHIPVAMLTHVDAAGTLVSRPMSPLEMDGSSAIWFFVDRRMDDRKDLAVLNLSFADSRRAIYVSLSGAAEIEVDRERIKRLWSPFARPWFPGGPDADNLALLKFIPEVAEYWDAPHNRMVRMFALAASVVVGKPLGMGQHEYLNDLGKPAPARTASRPSWRYARGAR